MEQGLRNWIAAANKAFATGDTKDLRALSDKTCNCLQIAAKIEKTASAGGIQGLTWTVRSPRIFNVHFGIADAQFDMEESAYRVLSHGKWSDVQRASRANILAEFGLTRGVWQMLDFDLIKKVSK